MYLHNPNATHHALLENFLEQELPIQMLAHLTFPRSVSRELCDDRFDRWLDKIEREHRTQLGYIVGYEKTPLIPLHLHAALIAPRPLDVVKVENAWLTVIGETHPSFVEVSEYRHSEGGLAYALKADDEDCCDVRFSKNLELFSLRHDLPTDGMTARDRRRRLRITDQFDNSGPKALSD